MSTVVKNVRSSRRRIVGALAGLAIGGAAVLVPGAIAQASPSDTPTLAGPGTVDRAKVTYDKIPAGARRVTGSKPTPGAHGPAFQQSTLADVSPYVVGGQLADPKNYPGVVGIQTYFMWPDETGTWVYWVATCTGSVVSATKVLTAAHCTVAYPFATTYVIAGRQNLDDFNSGGFVARVGSTWTNQGYNYADPNAVAPVDDVSVLTLKDALPSTYTPVTLTAQGDQSPYAAGTQAKIAGYGVTSNDPNAYAGVLHEATVPMQSDSTCASTFGSAYDQNRMICAGTPGVDSCHGDSGGPIFVGTNTQAGIVDWGPNNCAESYGVYERLSYYHNQVTQDLTRPAVVNLDWSGDGHSDLIGRNGVGELIEVTGTGLGTDGYGGIGWSKRIGQGWQGFNKVFRVTNWNGDGRPSIMARDSAGRLFQYTSDDEGNFTGTKQVGTSWNGYTDIMVTNNWTGNGRPNLMGRTSTGDLYLYTSDGNGGWMNGGIGIKIGTSWNGFNTVLTPGTWAGDGHQALIGRTSSGDLMLYKSDGSGGWMNGGIGVKIGSGWGVFKTFMSPGDWNGDRQVDLMGVTSAGDLFVYKTDGYGNWLDNGRGQQVDSGWNAFNTVF